MPALSDRGGAFVAGVAVVLIVAPGTASAVPSWSAPIVLARGVALTAIACPSDTQCTAVGAGSEVTFNPASPGGASPITLDPVGTLEESRVHQPASARPSTAADRRCHSTLARPVLPLPSRSIAPSG